MGACRPPPRAAFEAFFAKLPPTEVVLKACGGSHHWGRRPQAMGHRVKLIAPQYVKPFVKLGKNDRDDAEAISEAASRPSMRVVPVRGAGHQALALTVDPKRFKCGRHFAARLGLTPQEQSTGGRQRRGKISREGNERLRALLVLGATAVVQHAKPGSRTASPWLLQLLERRPRKVVAVALANKIARFAWAMTGSHRASAMGPGMSGEVFRGSPRTA